VESPRIKVQTNICPWSQCYNSPIQCHRPKHMQQVACPGFLLWEMWTQGDTQKFWVSNSQSSFW